MLFADGDEVSCTWTATGKEYTGKIARTCKDSHCLPWIRSIHKLAEHVASEDILEKIPDRSLIEASNYCRNPTNDVCGPWCYTSNLDNRTEPCCVPDCTSANKGNIE